MNQYGTFIGFQNIGYVHKYSLNSGSAISRVSQILVGADMFTSVLVPFWQQDKNPLLITPSNISNLDPPDRRLPSVIQWSLSKIKLYYHDF